MFSAIARAVIIVLIISLIPACGSIIKPDKDKVIVHKKKYEDGTGDCDRAYSNNCAQIKIEFPQVEYSQKPAVANRINKFIREYLLQPLFHENPPESVEKLIDKFLREYETFKSDFPEAFQLWSLERTGKVRSFEVK